MTIPDKYEGTDFYPEISRVVGSSDNAFNRMAYERQQDHEMWKKRIEPQMQRIRSQEEVIAEAEVNTTPVVEKPAITPEAPMRARLTWLGNFLDRYCSAFDGFEAPFMFGSALSILLAVHMWVAVFIPWIKNLF